VRVHLGARTYTFNLVTDYEVAAAAPYTHRLIVHASAGDVDVLSACAGARLSPTTAASGTSDSGGRCQVSVAGGGHHSWQKHALPYL
jgi:hypothetical protein